MTIYVLYLPSFALQIVGEYTVILIMETISLPVAPCHLCFNLIHFLFMSFMFLTELAEVSCAGPR